MTALLAADWAFLERGFGRITPVGWEFHGVGIAASATPRMPLRWTVTARYLSIPKPGPYGRTPRRISRSVWLSAPTMPDLKGRAAALFDGDWIRAQAHSSLPGMLR